LINAVAAAGFTLVRVPVTWSLHTGAAPEYLIDAVFLERVAQVVDMVHAAGMLALINLHHDGADAYGGEVEWLSLNDGAGLVTDANNQAVEARFSALWTQIATRFGPYGEGLLFESMNEINDGYDAPAVEYHAIINRLNQLFVETVRATGSNNAQRHLVVPGYNTNVDYTLQGFTTPVDSIAGRLILSVHYYDPWSFAGEGSANTWGTGQMGAVSWGQEDHVVTQFNALKTTYVDAGLPVIIGEYGAVNQEGYEDYRRYYMEYVTLAAIERGIVPIYWDNGSEESGAEAFGLFNRETSAVLHPTILEAMMRAKDESRTLSDIEPPTPE
jgi:endoglucanase